MNRKHIGKTDILSHGEGNTSQTWYQVSVGDFGVVLPMDINVDTLDGLKLLNGKGSVINDPLLAEKVAESIGGKVLKITENWELLVEVVKSPETSRDVSIDGAPVW